MAGAPQTDADKHDSSYCRAAKMNINQIGLGETFANCFRLLSVLKQCLHCVGLQPFKSGRDFPSNVRSSWSLCVFVRSAVVAFFGVTLPLSKDPLVVKLSPPCWLCSRGTFRSRALGFALEAVLFCLR